MRTTLFLLMVTISQVFASNIFSQNVRLNLNLKNVAIRNVLQKIEDNSEFYFMYDATQVDVSQKVDISGENLLVTEILDKIFLRAGITYEINNRQIALNSIRYNSPNVQSNKKITGTVTDSSGSPLPGVTVVIKGTTQGTITGADGNYSLNNIPANAVLVFSFVGMKTQEIVVAGRTELNVSLEEETIGIDEVVTIGYATQKKGLLTGSVSTVKITEEMTTIPTTSSGDMIAGKIAGVMVTTARGIPGSETGISIRTRTSWNSEPVVFVIDGMIASQYEFNNVPSAEIESVTVLKDAAAAAVYGARSAGGVIILTTKRGKEGKPVIKYQASYGFDKRAFVPSRTSAVQQAESYSRVNPTSDPYGWKWTEEEIDHYRKNINNGWGYDNLEAVWTTPSIKNHNLSITGGNDRLSYFASASYVKQQGFMDPFKFDKYNLRMNVTAKVAKGLEAFASLSLSDNKTRDIPPGVRTGSNDDLYGELLVCEVDIPFYTNSGLHTYYDFQVNYAAHADGLSGYDKYRSMEPRLIFELKYDVPFLKGLSLKGSYSQRWSFDTHTLFAKNYTLYRMKRSGAMNHIWDLDDSAILGEYSSSYIPYDYLQKEADWNGTHQVNFQAGFNRTFDKHYVQAVLVYERAEDYSDGVYGKVQKFPIVLTDEFWAASSSNEDSWAGGPATTLTGRASFIGQFNYTYANKYLFNFSFREDGSMKFSPENRWGFFPAASAGWVISEEPFFNQNAINSLKIRASVGLTGNDSVGGWQWQESYNSGSTAFLGDPAVLEKGITYGRVVNPNLTWEKNLGYNFGVDMHFLEKFNVTTEYWFKKSYDILGSRVATTPTTFTRAMPSENYGIVHAQGVDIELGYQQKIREIKFHAGITASYGWNEVIKKDYAENALWQDIPEGKSQSYILGYRFDKILRTQEDLDAFKAQYPNYRIGGSSPALGMMVYKDLSGPDGTPDGTITTHDRDILYDKHFPVVLGFNLGGEWKGFSVDMMFAGEIGYKKSLLTYIMNPANQPYEFLRMWTEWYSNAWTPETPDAWLPKQLSNRSQSLMTYRNQSDFWYRNADYLRLRYLNVGYTIPPKLYNKVFDNVKVFFSGKNLFQLSKFGKKYYDPELSTPWVYPVMATYSFGVDITL